MPHLEYVGDLIESGDDLQGVDRVLRLVDHAEAGRTVTRHLDISHHLLMIRSPHVHPMDVFCLVRYSLQWFSHARSAVMDN